MDREQIYNIIVNILPTYSAGQLKGVIEQDCCILRREMNMVSMNSSLGYWDHYCIDIYTVKSPLELDKYVKLFYEALEEHGCEVQTLISGDYWDDFLRAFSTSLQFRIPKTY